MRLLAPFMMQINIILEAAWRVTYIDIYRNSLEWSIGCRVLNFFYYFAPWNSALSEKEKSILFFPILHYFLCQLSTKIGGTICIYYSTAQPFPIAVFRHKIMKISIVIIVVYYTCYKSSMNPMLWCLTLEQ